jgi:hypothetical protein
MLARRAAMARTNTAILRACAQAKTTSRTKPSRQLPGAALKANGSPARFTTASARPTTLHRRAATVTAGYAWLQAARLLRDTTYCCVPAAAAAGPGDCRDGFRGLA